MRNHIVCLYLTPIVLLIWAVFLFVTGDNPIVIGLLAVSASVAVQSRELINLYTKKGIDDHDSA